MIAARAATGSSTGETATLTGRPGLAIPFYRCTHRTAARRPAPARGKPNRQRCIDCGAYIDSHQDDDA